MPMPSGIVRPSRTNATGKPLSVSTVRSASGVALADVPWLARYCCVLSCSLWAMMVAGVDACGVCGRAVAGSMAGRAEAAGAAIARIAAVVMRRREVFMGGPSRRARCGPVTAA